MIISMIVAVSTNGVIGSDNKLLWHLPNDLKRFKNLTINNSILLGRKTFDSLGKVLPNRKHLVISNNELNNIENVWYFKSIKQAIDFANINNSEEVIICGGGEIYKQTFDIASVLYLTRVHANINGDTCFNLPDDWKLVSKESYLKDDKHEYDYDFEMYLKM